MDYARRRILEPLGMRSSSFEWNDSIAARAAVPYKENGKETFPQLRYPAAAPAGLYSTIDDMAAFLLAHCDRPGHPAGGGVISPASVRQIMRPDSTAIEYGMGYEITAFGDRPAAGHSGSNPGWKANILFVPERALSLVVMTNIDGGRTRMRIIEAIRANVTR